MKYIIEFSEIDTQGFPHIRGLFTTHAAAHKFINGYIDYLWEDAMTYLGGEELEEEKIRLSELKDVFLPSVDTFDVKPGHGIGMNRFSLTTLQLYESEEDIDG